MRKPKFRLLGTTGKLYFFIDEGGGLFGADHVFTMERWRFWGRP